MDVTRESMKTSRRAQPQRDGLYGCQGRLGVGCVCSVSSLGTYLLQVPWPKAKVLALPPFGFLSKSSLDLALLPRFLSLPLAFYQL